MDKIPVFVTADKAFAWRPQDVQNLRNHRIVGALIGSLPRAPQQNIFFGLPLVLNQEEVTLLLDEEIIVLVKDSGFESRIAERIRSMDSDHQETSGSSKNHLITPTSHFGSATKSLDNDELNSSNEDISNCSINLNDLDSAKYATTLSEAWKKGLWNFPEKEIDWDSYFIFKHLWKQGLFITEGSKFGGRWLGYPGDPTRYHSHYIITIIPYRSSFSPLDIIAFGRLGTSTKKTHVVCSVQSQGGEQDGIVEGSKLDTYQRWKLKDVIHYTIEWTDAFDHVLTVSSGLVHYLDPIKI
ncbi:hypothetical protein BKA69DRAFT_1071451 [Paraphysoderma sedebokerense]|nr:hypothetical protein BKA69DRAFT_1071451 [Paraphysoderma sedebokerense]